MAKPNLTYIKQHLRSKVEAACRKKYDALHNSPAVENALTKEYAEVNKAYKELHVKLQVIEAKLRSENIVLRNGNWVKYFDRRADENRIQEWREVKTLEVDDFCLNLALNGSDSKDSIQAFIKSLEE
jgi:hypothetical protein